MLEKRGLVKLVEEAGELQIELGEATSQLGRLTQIACKKSARIDSDVHWDEQGSLKSRLENEIADTFAAMNIVIKNFSLDKQLIKLRMMEKFNLFLQWDTED